MVEVGRHSVTIGLDVRQPAGDVSGFGGGEERGRVRIGFLVFVLLLIVAGYLGLQVLFAYVNYLAFADSVRIVVNDVTMAPKQADEGAERILAKARELDLPVSEKQVALTVGPDMVQAKVRWKHPIGLWGYKTFLTFEIDESRRLR
jgi:hypothetical protein